MIAFNLIVNITSFLLQLLLTLQQGNPKCPIGNTSLPLTIIPAFLTTDNMIKETVNQHIISFNLSLWESSFS